MYTCKEGVDDSQLKPQMRIALMRVSQVLEEFSKPLIVTSTYDGMHAQNSLHYHHLAVDIRTRHLGNDVNDIYVAIRDLLQRMSNHYQVILGNSYIHIEFDRRFNGIG